MRDFARYVILSPVVPAPAMARPIPSTQSSNLVCDAGNFDPNDLLALDGKPLPLKSLARGKRNPTS